MTKRFVALSCVFLVLVFSGIVACGGGGGGSSSSKAPGVVFVSSVEGSGDLSSWTDAGGATGLAAADNVCQAMANSAGLDGTFVAWLSDDTDDAYCRVLGLSGKKSTLCDGAYTAQITAGPWVRTDGTPFANSLEEAVFPNNKIYSPVRYDESGVLHSATYFTATDGGGELSYDSPCINWTETYPTYAPLGTSEGTGGAWSFAYSGQCNALDPRHLLCMQTGEVGALSMVPETGNTVFVTSAEYNGDLGGIDGANSKCQASADAVGLAGNYKAWLSTSFANAVDRILDAETPLVTVDGVKVANSVSDIVVDQALLTAISVTEAGDYLDYTAFPWTGTKSSGIYFGGDSTCSDWTDGTSGSSGRRGAAVLADVYWTSKYTSSCSIQERLYCIEDTACNLSGTLSSDASFTPVQGDAYTINLYADAVHTDLVATYSSTFAQDGSTAYSMDVSSLPPGTYYITVDMTYGVAVDPVYATIGCGTVLSLVVHLT